MRPGGGKAKGGAFERLVCERLSLWVSGGTDHDLFWRSAMSGGRATVGRRTGKGVSRQAGDICAVAPEGHVLTNVFYIECKHYADLQIANFFLNGTGTLASFWAETVRDAVSHGRRPILVAKENRRQILMVTEPKDWYKLGPLSHRPLATRHFTYEDAEVRNLDDVLSSPYNWNENQ